MMTIFFLVCVLCANAQQGELIIKGLTGNLYLGHSVAPKETWYSLGRMYNVEPKSLARFNHQTFGHALDIGQEVKIPLTTANFSQDGRKLSSETLVPVYHIVQEKEWLYRISVNHNKVPIPALEKWNHVTGDEVHAGLHLIVGYLKVRTALSALAKERAEPPVARALMPPPETVRPAGVAANNGGAHAEEGKDQQSDTGSGLHREPVRPAPVPVQETTSQPAPHFEGGRFKEDFSDGGHSVSGQAGIFKSRSGWQDGKYYALINSVPVGTIVRITDPSNGKIVYAKVLGQLPEMKESAGLTIRLSNAAAAELGEGDTRFGVGVSY